MKKIKRKDKKLLILALCVSVLLSVLPLYAWASSGGTEGNIVGTTAPETIPETTGEPIAETVAETVGEITEETLPGEFAPIREENGACEHCGTTDGIHAANCAAIQVTPMATETPIAKASDFPSDGNLVDGVTYKLTGNITNCQPLYVQPGRTVTIELNGRMLEGKGVDPVITVMVDSTTTDGVETVHSKGKLIITNVNAGNYKNDIGGKINENGVWVRSDERTFNMHCAIIYNKGTGVGIDVQGDLEMTGGTIIGCQSGASGTGAAICGTSTATIRLTNVDICYNRTTRTFHHDTNGNLTTTLGLGGVVHSEQDYHDDNVTPSLIATGCNIYNNSSVSMGGGVSGGNITLNSCNIYNNKAFNGGGVYAVDNLTVNDGKIYNNQATNEGGGIWTAASNTVLTNVTISGNNNTGTIGDQPYGTAYPVRCWGGGLFVYGQTKKCTLAGTTKLENNTSKGSGGGIYCNGVLTIRDSVIIQGNSTETSGGGIYSAQVVMEGGTVQNNTAAYEGGGIGATFQITVTGGTIKGNQAGTSGGGIARVNNDAQYGGPSSVTGCTIESNTAGSNGGGIAVMDKQFTIGAGTVIQKNSATGNGGGIYSQRGRSAQSDVTVNGGALVFDNTAGGHGGGIYGATNVNLTVTGSAKIDDNQTTAGNGGGIYCYSTGVLTVSGGAQVTNNKAGGSCDKYSGTGNGGGIFCGSVVADGAVITGNTAMECGGGIHFSLSANVSNCTLNGNHAGEVAASDSGHNHSGGAIYSSNSNVEFSVTDSTLNNNDCQGSGGAIFIGPATVDVDGCTIEGNTARDDGGAIYGGTGSVITVSGGSLLAGNSAAAGGAVFQSASDGSSIVRVIASEISGNTASENGGGIRSAGQVFLEEGATISSNTAATEGGGIHAGTVTVSGTEAKPIVISGNHGKNGGGIYCTSRLVMQYATMENNTAAGNGGAVATYLGSAANAVYAHTISNSTFRNNSAVNGGALYLTAAATGDGCTVTDCTVTGNTATKDGGGICAGNKVTISGGTVSGNRAADYGGGVHFMADSTATVSNVTVSGNDAIGMGTSQTGRGGGFSVLGTVTFTNVTVSQNRAMRYGGGLNLDSGASVTWNGGSIQDNQTLKEGAGAVHVNGATFNFNSGTISGNSAYDVGGAIHTNGGTVNIYGGSIRDNTVTGGRGGAIHGNGSATINIISGTISGNRALSGQIPKVVTMASDKPGAAVANVTYQDSTWTTDGGALAINNATAVIGVSGCTGSGNNHSGSYTDKTHPVITGNSAGDTGGAVAVLGNGTVTVHCGTVADNTAANAGRGNNIYSDGAGVILHNAVGTSGNPGVVAVSGKLQRAALAAAVNLYYYQDNAGTTPGKTAAATENELFHLPDATKYWSKSGYTFMGWTFRGPNSPPVYVRSASAYKPTGSVVTAADGTDGNTGDSTVHMYALWAPNTNAISYRGCVIDGIFREDALADSAGGNPTSYSFSAASATAALTAPNKAGYTFLGWYVYQDADQNANWGYELSMTDNRPDDSMYFLEAGQALPVGDARFGNITLIPAYRENTVTYTYHMVAPGSGVAGYGSLAQGGTAIASGYTDTVKVDSGNPHAVTATAAHRYKFVGWYSDAACQNLVTADATLPLNKVDGLYPGGTFYAKFEFYLTDLTISAIPPAGTFRDQQSFIYEVRDSRNRLITVITMESGKSVTVCDLYIGETYTVTEIQSWSWRFAGTASKSLTLDVSGNALTFTPVETEHRWLTHDVLAWLRKGA